MNWQRLALAEKRFLAQYPDGFQDPAMVEIIKKHKPEKMTAMATEAFAKSNFKKPELIVDQMARIIGASSMVSMFEKPKFRDFAKGLADAQKRILSQGLFEFLYGDQEKGFGLMLSVLEKGSLAKWTVLTVCPAYFAPDREVYVKPSTTKDIIRHLEIPNLEYKPRPTFAFYEGYRKLINQMKKKVHKSLRPSNAAFTGFLMSTLKDAQ